MHQAYVRVQSGFLVEAGAAFHAFERLQTCVYYEVTIQRRSRLERLGAFMTNVISTLNSFMMTEMVLHGCDGHQLLAMRTLLLGPVIVEGQVVNSEGERLEECLSAVRTDMFSDIDVVSTSFEMRVQRAQSLELHVALLTVVVSVVGVRQHVHGQLLLHIELLTANVAGVVAFPFVSF